MTARATDAPAGQDEIRWLLIKAKGGLGNRMLSAVTGLVYADLTGRTPVIDWSDGVYAPQGRNAYPLLFDAPDMPPVAALPQDAGIVPEFWKSRLDMVPDRIIETFEAGDHSNPRIYRKYSVALETLDHAEQVAVFWSYLPKMARLRRHLRADPRFRGRSTAEIFADYIARHFKPNTRVRDEVGAFVSGLPRPVIGVHVRYTDRKFPLDKVVSEIERQKRAMPGAAIFLATDSGIVEDRMRQEFSEVHTTPKYLPTDDERLHSTQQTVFDKVHEAENAMIDMWTLAQCDMLIYSKNSTFSLCSALIGDLRKDQQVDIDRHNLPIVVKRLVQPFI